MVIFHCLWEWSPYHIDKAIGWKSIGASRRMSPLRWSLIALFWARNHLRCITWGWFPPTGAMEMETINLGTGSAGSLGFRGRWWLVGSSGWIAGGVLMLLDFPFCVECCWSVDGFEEALLWGIGRILNKYLTCGRMGPTTEAPQQILSRSR